MTRFIHRTFGQRVEFDFWNENGILGALADKRKIAWGAIVCVIGYPKSPGLFGPRFGITVAFQEQDGVIQYVEVLSTSNEWKYRYYLEKTVAYMCKKKAALGGETWCARPLNKDGSLEENDLFRSYVLCRIIADKSEIPVFEHSQEDEAAVALTFIGKRLIADGTEVSQLSRAIEETRFPFISTLGSMGYNTLYDYRLRMINREAQQNHAPDG